MKRTTIEFMISWLDAGTITRIDDYADRHDALAAAGLSDATASA